MHQDDLERKTILAIAYGISGLIAVIGVSVFIGCLLGARYGWLLTTLGVSTVIALVAMQVESITNDDDEEIAGK